MDRYREKLIALLREELRILEDTNLPIRELYYLRRCFPVSFLREARIIQEKIDKLSEQIRILSCIKGQVIMII